MQAAGAEGEIAKPQTLTPRDAYRDFYSIVFFGNILPKTFPICINRRFSQPEKRINAPDMKQDCVFPKSGKLKCSQSQQNKLSHKSLDKCKLLQVWHNIIYCKHEK